MNNFSFNKLYFKFSNGKITCTEFEGYIYNYYLFNQDKTIFSNWPKNEYEDFVSWFYPRIKKAIDTYFDIGASFEAFMKKLFKMSGKEYQVRTTSKSITEYSAWCAQVPEMYVREEAPEYLHKNGEKIISTLVSEKKGRKTPRRILALILKNYNYVSDDFLDRIAPKIGINKEELREMMERIKKIRRKRDDGIYSLKERIYCQFYRCIIYDRKLAYITDNPMAYNNLKLKRDKARQRLENMRKRLSTIRTDATNKQVANVIGIKKGTVDASLFKLKEKLVIIKEKALLN